MKKVFYLVCDYREKDSNNKSYKDSYSLQSILQIQNALQDMGYHCFYFGGTKELISAIHTNNYDKNGIYLNFSDGLVSKSQRGQAPMLLELMKVKYSGSSALTHLAVSDKYFTNKFLMNRIPNLNIPNCIIINDKDQLKNVNFGFPIILKPNDAGSSIGITKTSICYNMEDVRNQYSTVEKFGKILAQKFIGGYELTNYFIRDGSNKFLFNKLLLISKGDSMQLGNNVFTAEDKFEHKRKYYNPNLCLSVEQILMIKRITEQLAQELDIVTIGRIDYRLFSDKLYFIEANTVPAFSLTSDIGEICRIFNLNFTDIVKLLIASLD